MPFIVDKNISNEIIINLNKIDKIIFTDELKDVYEPVNTHPDIQIHFFNKNNAICCPETYDYYKKNLPEYINLTKGSKSIGRRYPYNIAYNVSVIGKNLVCLKEHTEEKIIDSYNREGYNIINIKQGYSKCNICIVSDNAVITEDAGIKEKLEKENIDVCLISPGSVGLKNFNYGFIGGASGTFDNKIYFTGDINNHPEYQKIKNFIYKYKKEYVCLSDNRLWDYGSIFKI